MMLPDFTNLESLLGGGSTAPTMPGPVAAEPMPAARPDLPRPGGGGDGFDWKKLLPMLPAIMGVVTKDGGVAAEAFQRGAERRRREQMQQEEVSRRAQLEKQTAETREAAAKRQTLLDERAVLQDAAEELNGITDPNLYETALARHEAMAQRFGLPEGAVSGRFKFNTTGATAASAKAAADKLESLRKAGYDLTDEKVVNGLSVPFQGKQVPLSELLVMAGAPTKDTPGMVAPLGMRSMTQIKPAGKAPVLPTPKEETSSGGSDFAKFLRDEFAIEKENLGRELTPADRRRVSLRARREFNQVDDRAPRGQDPTTAAINALRLEQMQRGQGSMTPAQASLARGLSDDYEKASKDYLVRLSAAQTVETAAKDPSAAGDLALIFSFMKMLDPGSTVREGEFANAQNAAGVGDQIRNAYNRTMNGQRLNPTQRADFVRQAQAQFQQARTRQRGLIQVYTSRARRGGLNPEDVVIDYDSVFGVNAEPAPAAGGFSVQAPDGQTFRFDSQAQLDAFKKKAGIQ